MLNLTKNSKVVELTFEQYNQRLSDQSRYVSSDGSGNYHCSLCEHTWRAYKRYMYWPVAIRWQRKASHKWINWHGWQIAYEGIEQKVFGWTLHLGALKVCFGSGNRIPERTHYTWKSPAVLVPSEDAILFAEYVSDQEQ